MPEKLRLIFGARAWWEVEGGRWKRNLEAPPHAEIPFMKLEVREE